MTGGWVLVRLTGNDATTARTAFERAKHIYRRSESLLAGDRSETNRLDAVLAGVEYLGRIALDRGAENVRVNVPTDPSWTVYVDPSNAPAEAAHWVTGGDVAVAIRDVFAASEDERTFVDRGGEIPSVERWVPTSGNWKVEVETRFRQRLAQAVDGPRSGLDDSVAVDPSGISNDILTSALRDAVHADIPVLGTRFPVVYKDGSAAPTFPAHSLCLGSGQLPLNVGMSFSLMSVRHTELDSVVDAAWFRNVVLSRQRPAADTDTIAYETSLDQFDRLLGVGINQIHIYNTGFEPAVMGFYRAAADTLAAHPELVVQPWYFRSQTETYLAGELWGRA